MCKRIKQALSSSYKDTKKPGSGEILTNEIDKSRLLSIMSHYYMRRCI
jgi:hypothetical protein